MEIPTPSTSCQRWRERRSSSRPVGEPFNPRRYEASPIDTDTEARAFVVEHHYSGSYPAAVYRAGLWGPGGLEGVAVFSVPPSAAVLTNRFGTVPAAELGRFVLLDGVAGNGESWFLARAFELLRRDKGTAAVLSHADPIPREDAAGRLVTPGHYGCIYQAHNGRYLGRSTARTLRLLPDGTVLSARTLQKIRSAHRGWVAAVATLVDRYGAPPLDIDADRPERMEWVRRLLTSHTRKLRHPGNYAYGWRLDWTGAPRLFANPEQYPKPAAPAA